MLDAHTLFRRQMTDPQPCLWRRDSLGKQRPRLAEDGVASMCVRINDDWHAWPAWVFDKSQTPHGPMLFEMTHFTDLCNWFLAEEPTEVFAVKSGILNHAVTIRYRGGQLATIGMYANGSFGYPKELYEVIGGGAVVVVDHMVEVRTAGLADAPALRNYPLLTDSCPEVGREGGLRGWLAKRRNACDEAARRGDRGALGAAEPDKGHARHMDRFIDEILGIGPQVCGVDDAVMATRVAFAAIRSAAEHRPVAMEEV